MRNSIKQKYRIVILVMIFTCFMSLQQVYADTLEDYLNNLIGPRQQYNTSMSPIYLRNNNLEEYISPQSGELTISQTDFSLPGRNGLDLEIKRIYNSNASSWYDMKAKYVNGAWVDYINSDATVTTFFEDRYNLGVAMRFSFPTMEIKTNTDGTSYKFLHTDTGDTYRLNDPTVINGVNNYTLENHTVKDIEVRDDTSYTNGQTDGTSKYVMIEKNGKKTYFADDGRVLGIVDRYGNRIKFEYSILTYTVDGNTKTRKLITKITDTLDRVVNIEYQEDPNFVATKNADGSYNPDLNGKFRVIVYLPDSTPGNLSDNKKIIYDKTGVLISSTSGHVIRTRIQRVYDTDSAIKYQYWFEQVDTGFTFMNGSTYAVKNRFDNLVQIDYYKTNRLKRYTYELATRKLNDNSGSMQYRRISKSMELEKTGWDDTKPNYLDKYITNTKNVTTYTYTGTSDGYGVTGYDANNEDYLKNTYRYYSEKTDNRGAKTKYTYNGKNELLTTEYTGANHKEVTTTTYDNNKLPSKQVKETFNVATGTSVKKLENFTYDEYGNLMQYTGPMASRDANGNPTDAEYNVTYTYAVDRYHIPTSKTWKINRGTTSRVEYTVNNLGNITEEKKVHYESGVDKSILTDYQYDSYGNMVKKTVNSPDNTYVTNYEYAVDADGVNQMGGYLTREYMVKGTESYDKKYSYNFYTGDKTAEVDERGNKTTYLYDLPGRIIKITYPDATVTKEYTYNDSWIKNREIVYKDPNGNKLLYSYDIFGNLAKYSVMDKDGNWIALKTYEYDSNSNKTKETDSNGNYIKFTYDTANRLTSKSYYDKNNNLKEGMQLSYAEAFDASTPLLLTVTDEEGYKSKYSFDIENRLIRLEVTADKTNYYATAFNYDYVGNKTSVKDGMGNTTYYTYDDLNRLAAQRDAAGYETYYTYNNIDKLLKKEEPGEKVTELVYDVLGRAVAKKTYKKGSADYYYEYYTNDKAGNVTELKQGSFIGGADKLSFDDEYTYDNLNRLSEEYKHIDAARKSYTKYEYDKNSNRTNVTEYANSDRSKYIRYNYDYDFAGNIILEESFVRLAADGSEAGHSLSKYYRDYEGNITKKEEYGDSIVSTTYAYDHRNRMTEKVEPYSNTGATKKTSYTYDKKGNLTSEAISIQGVLCTKAYEYDGVGDIIRITDALGNTTRYVYDANKNKTKELDARYYTKAQETANANVINTLPRLEYEYDALNRPVRTTAVDGAAKTVLAYMEYDGRGNLSKKADGYGYVSDNPSGSLGDIYTYDINDKVSTYTSAATVKYNRASGQNKLTAKYIYDGSGNVTCEEDSLGSKTYYTYYQNGMLKDKTYADNVAESYDYDLTGKLEITLKDRAQNITKQYMNVFDKPYMIQYPDGSKESFEYTAFGQVKKATDRNGNIKSFSYDLNNNPVSEDARYKEDGQYYYNRINRYSYDEANNLLTSESYTYTINKANGSKSSEQSLNDKVQYAYDNAGRPIRQTGPNGREILYNYDNKGNLITRKDKVSDGYYNVTRFTYDLPGNLTAKTLLVEASDLKGTYSGSLLDAEYPTRVKVTENYAYYNNGKLKSRTDAKGKISSYEYDNDGRITRVVDPKGNDTRYAYDLSGNLIEERNAQGVSIYYGYDELRRLIRKKTPAADGSDAVVRYIYDVMGNKVKEILPNNYDPAKDTVALANTMLGTSYAYDSMNRLVSVTSPKNETVQYLKYDANGNVVKAVDGLRYLESSGATQADKINNAKGTEYTYDSMNKPVKVKNAKDEVTIYEYDAFGNIIKQTDARNFVTVYEYNADNTLARVTYPDTGVIEFTYDKLGNKLTQKDQRGNVTAFEYNAFGKIRSIKDANLDSMSYKYDLNGNVAAEKDKKGYDTEYSYDENNRPTEIRRPLELSGSNILYSIAQYEYDEVGNVIRKTITGTKDSGVVRETYISYYRNNLPDTVKDNSGSYTKNYYDKNGNVVKTAVLRGNGEYDIVKNEYDNQNRLTKSIMLVDESDIYTGGITNISRIRDSEYAGKLQLITEYVYDMLGNKKEVRDPRYYGSSQPENYVAKYDYDILNRVEKITRKHDVQDTTIQYTYDELGNKIKEKTVRGFELSYTYDSMNRPKSSTNELGNTMTYGYDLAGNLVSLENAKGDKITYTYDKLNRQDTVKDAYGVVIKKNVYDKNGNIAKAIDAKGYLSAGDDAARYGTVYEYNLANLPVKVTDPENGVTRYDYNQFGDTTKQIDQMGNATQYVYDDGGKLQKVIDACNIETSFTYDKRGNKLSMTDGKGNVTYYRYGAFGILAAVVNANGDTMSLKYDLMLNKARLLDENKHETLLSYNNMNLLAERKVADTNDVVSYKYDEAGNRVELTDATGTTTYEYDAANQLTERTKNGTTELSYSYDEVGNVTSVTDNKGNTTEYGYDKSNRMTTVGFKVSGNTRTTTYTYDKNGNREAVIYHSGIREDYTYDKNNRLLKLTNSKPDGSVISSYEYTYDLAGRQISKTDSFGTTRYTYDADGRVKQIEAPGKTTVYMFDEAGNRVSMNESFASEQSSGYIDRKTNAEVKYVLKKSEYAYSNNNELLKLVEKMCDAGGKVLFSKVSVMKYDRNGNQTRQTVEYTKPKEDGATVAAPTFKGQVFGENANIAFEGMVENTMNDYDGFNRLKKTELIKTGLRTIVEFSYDGDDLRVRKTVKKSSGNYTEEVTNYLYDRQHVILETDGTGNIKARYVKGINYIARIDGSNKLSYMLYNGHGDVVQTVSQTGNVENRYDYDIFGMPTLTIESYSCSIRYAGEYYDAETGLYYLRARYYNPQIGRFISEDSYWGEDSNPLSLNLYTYCQNDPIQFADPSGHWISTDPGGFKDPYFPPKDKDRDRDKDKDRDRSDYDTGVEQVKEQVPEDITKQALEDMIRVQQQALDAARETGNKKEADIYLGRLAALREVETRLEERDAEIEGMSQIKTQVGDNESDQSLLDKYKVQSDAYNSAVIAGNSIEASIYKGRMYALEIMLLGRDIEVSTPRGILLAGDPGNIDGKIAGYNDYNDINDWRVVGQDANQVIRTYTEAWGGVRSNADIDRLLKTDLAKTYNNILHNRKLRMSAENLATIFRYRDKEGVRDYLGSRRGKGVNEEKNKELRNKVYEILTGQKVTYYENKFGGWEETSTTSKGWVDAFINGRIASSADFLLDGSLNTHFDSNDITKAGLGIYATISGAAEVGLILKGIETFGFAQATHLYNTGLLSSELAAMEKTVSIATETFYRTMSKVDYETFIKTGKIPATGETFISPTKAYSAQYDGILVKFEVKVGTTQSLEAIGVRDISSITVAKYQNMPIVDKGWTQNNAFFKGEGIGGNKSISQPQINIGLGKGKALDIFNNNIVKFEEVPR